MRIRSFKPEIFQSEDITALTFPARWTFMGLIAYVDDAGRGRADPRLIKAAIYPIDDGINSSDISKWIEELEKRSLVCLYWVGEVGYLHVVNFARHQKINRPTPSKIMSCFRPQHGVRMNDDRWVQLQDGTIHDIPPQGGHPEESIEHNPRSYGTHGGLTEPSVTPHGGLINGKEQGTGKRNLRTRPSADPVADAPGALSAPADDGAIPGLDIPKAEPKLTTTQRLIGYWLDALPHRPHPRTVGAVSKFLKEETERGIPKQLLETAISEWITSGKSGVAILRSMTDGQIHKAANTISRDRPHCEEHETYFADNCPHH